MRICDTGVEVSARLLMSCGLHLLESVMPPPTSIGVKCKLVFSVTAGEGKRDHTLWCMTTRIRELVLS